MSILYVVWTGVVLACSCVTHIVTSVVAQHISAMLVRSILMILVMVSISRLTFALAYIIFIRIVRGYFNIFHKAIKLIIIIRVLNEPGNPCHDLNSTEVRH